MKDRKATISDVAKTTGVSKATVSNYLNKRYDRMKPETKERIQEAIEGLDYVPSISARRLSAKEKSKAIGLIIPGNLAEVFDTMYYPTVFGAVGKAAEEAGYSVLIYMKNNGTEEEQLEYLLGLGKSLVDGFLVFALRPEDRYFKEFEKNGIPYVCVGKIAHYEDYHYVATDHGRAVEDSVKYLARLGHRRIAMFVENKVSVVEQIRVEAYEKIMKEMNLEYREDYCRTFYTHEITGEVEKAFSELLGSRERPTAFIVPAHFMRYLKNAVKKSNLYIPNPKDLSVIALEYYETYYPEYVTFQNMEYTRIPSAADRVSAQAFRKLAEMIEKPDMAFESCLETVELKTGRTTGAPAEEK